ncbi:hypothetical protein C8Q79DRAFT_210856 [Trametes meyenii]|nr:hypothetical protein C8Q79DRAFT_210856 [Trametes meyenii]
MKSELRGPPPGGKINLRHQPYNVSKTTGSNYKPHASSGHLVPPSAQSTLSETAVTKGQVSRNMKQRKLLRDDKSRRMKAIQDALNDTSDISSSSSSPNPATVATSLRTPRETIRDHILEIIYKHYPYFTPQSDFEIMCLGGKQYKGKPEDISAYMDKELASAIAWHGNIEAVMRWAKEYMDTKAVVTGAKPYPGDYGVFVRALPDSDYSIRLFPGSLVASEYCLDFVRTATGEAVNSPFPFQLYCGPNPSAPMGTGPAMQLRPLEHAFGISQKEIAPGEEKFLLRDGQTCLLRRPGHKDVQFVVPIRRRPEAPRPSNTHFLELPQHI